MSGSAATKTLQAKDLTLTDDLSKLANIIGLEAVLKICKEMGGSGIYFPKYHSVIRKFRNRMILSEFNGSNQNELANKYGVSKAWIYEILKQN